jgi:Mg-chelatase subunit ChlD
MKRYNRTVAVILLLSCLFSASAGLSLPHVSAAAPAPQTEVDVQEVISRLNSWFNNTYASYRFNEWIALGDINRVRQRFNAGDMQIYIDPDFLDDTGANAAYVDWSALGFEYFNDMVLADTPDKVPAQTLWHETMHAIFDDHDSDLLVDNDETYTWYMEGVMNTLHYLTNYEDELNKGGACDQKELDKWWQGFERNFGKARDTVEGPITDDAQIRQIRQLTGFHVDVEAIRRGYKEAGLDKCPGGVKITTDRTAPATLADLDLIFCIDVTGSMEDDIAGVKAAAASIVDTIAAKNDNWRVAIIAFRDWNDSEGYAMFEDFPFSRDKSTVIANVNSLSVGGGDDTPEAVFEALMRGIDSKSVGGWRDGANKQIILMGDAPPHNPSRNGLTPAIVAQAAKDADPVIIQSLVVGNYGDYNPEAVEAFRELAELTGGNFLEAADASQVPEMLQQTIEEIQPPGPVGLLSDTRLLLFGSLCCLGILGLGVVLFVVVFWGRKRRKSPRPAPAAPQYSPPPPAPQPAPAASHWQGETVVSPTVRTAELTVEEGPDAGQHFSLRPNTRLGRAADNDVVLQDPQVSRHHAVVSLSGSQWTIADLGSANGTRVNGVRIDQPRPLQPGDVIVLGSNQMIFRTR